MRRETVGDRRLRAEPPGHGHRLRGQGYPALGGAEERQGDGEPGQQVCALLAVALGKQRQRLLQQVDLGVVEQSHLEAGEPRREAERRAGEVRRPSGRPREVARLGERDPGRREISAQQEAVAAATQQHRALGVVGRHSGQRRGEGAGGDLVRLDVGRRLGRGGPVAGGRSRRSQRPRGAEVVGDLGVRDGSTAGQEGAGDVEMELTARRVGQPGLQGVTHEGVREPESSVAGDDDQPHLHRLVEEDRDVRRRQRQHPGQQSHVDDRTRDRRSPEDLGGRLAEPGHPSGDGRDGACGQGVADDVESSRRGQAADLADEQRVPAGAVGHPLRVGRRRVEPVLRLEDLVHLVDGQRWDRQDGGASQQPVELLRVRVVLPVRTEDQDRSALRRRREKAQEPQGALVRPVQVVEHE